MMTLYNRFIACALLLSIPPSIHSAAANLEIPSLDSQKPSFSQLKLYEFNRRHAFFSILSQAQATVGIPEFSRALQEVLAVANVKQPFDTDPNRLDGLGLFSPRGHNPRGRGKEYIAQKLADPLLTAPQKIYLELLKNCPGSWGCLDKKLRLAQSCPQGINVFLAQESAKNRAGAEAAPL